MSFRGIVRDVRDSIGNLSMRNFDFKLYPSNSRGKSQGSVHELHDQASLTVIQDSRWAGLPPELLRDVIKRLEESESTWPSRKHVVACAAVCRAWCEMCRELVKTPELCGKLTFPVSLKQPGPRDDSIKCFIKRDKSNLTYRLFLCLSPALSVENGKFLLSAKRVRRTTCTEYVISMHADCISRSSNTYLGKLRSNFLGTKFVVYDTQPPYNGCIQPSSQPSKSSRRFYSRKVSPKFPTGSYNIAQVTYELNVLGSRGPRRMHCTMYSIPASSLDVGGTVPGQPENLLTRTLGDSFGSMSFFVKPTNKIEVNKANKDMHPMFNEWLENCGLSFDDRKMRLEEGYIKEGSTITIIGILQRHDNILMIVPPEEPISTGCLWRRLLYNINIKGLVLIGDEKVDDEVITV